MELKLKPLKDLSQECGMHYAEYWMAVHVCHTMTEDEFHKWFSNYCAQCTNMCEICMAGE